MIRSAIMTCWSITNGNEPRRATWISVVQSRAGVEVAQGNSNVMSWPDQRLYTIARTRGVITARNPVTMHKIGTLNLRR